MALLAKRKVELSVDTIKIPDELEILFEVPFSDDNNINVTEIHVYNLSHNTTSKFKKGHRVVLNAGYESDSGTIFIGTLQRAYIEWENLDKRCTLVCADSLDTKLSQIVKKTYKKNSTSDTVLKDLIKLSGIRVVSYKLPEVKKYEDGLTLSDNLLKCLVQVANDSGAKVHLTKGGLYIRAESDIMKIASEKGSDSVVDLHSENGLIQSPTPIEKDGRTGWKVTSLLNHRINTDAIINLKSKTANGKFRVASGSHKKDGNSYYSEMELFA
ncbi:phage protein [Metabacillus litoralis]|uniref:phage protein n=1 Tax=Metabacillus litoralis TaxID=152268 RepID=UPI00203AB51B|nr:hypothetical protein [Metabacillus litoralis]MCM3413516.1 hypothetical protein [Metabacillus litoralis]